MAIEHRPRLLSDNGPAFLSGDLADYLETDSIRHTRGQPYHPLMQGKIERYHRLLKNVICLENHYFPWQLEPTSVPFVESYNHHHYHESLGNLTPANVYFGRTQHIQSQRDAIKHRTLAKRRTRHMLALSPA